MGRKVEGNLIIIGGAEDKRDDKVILREVVSLAGGPSARIAVMTVAAEDQEAVGRQYRDIFADLGVGNVNLVNIETRAEAFSEDNVGMLNQSTGIFFTGGDQLRITSLVGGSDVDRELHEAYERGVVIAGTSAGASAMSDTMIIEGDGRESPRNFATRMAPGMGLLEEVVIDQHFAQRGRIGRLMLAVAQNPYILGVGIDEDTAIVVGAEARFRVIGSGTVTVIDGSSLMHSSVSEQDLYQPVAILGVTVHTLAPGYGFDMARRRPIIHPAIQGMASLP
ncbi:MAG: cyanophycinase [Ignavibacteriales bacterium]